jgi:carboxyl-terminal processing protease
VKNRGFLKSCFAGHWRRRLFLATLSLSLGAYLCTLLAAAPPQSYESLRLITEAFYEISQKYVSQKGEPELIQGALRGLLNSLDPDSFFLTPKEFQDYQRGQTSPGAEAGVELIFKDNLLTVASAIDGGPGAKAGLKSGDHILKINGQLVRNLSAQEAARRFRGSPGTSLKVQVIRNGMVKPLDLTITLEPLGTGTVTSQVVKNAFGYIRIRYFSDYTPVELADAIKVLLRHQPPVRGVILDLRNNARGSLEQGVRTASVFLGGKEIVSTKGRPPEAPQVYQGKARDLAFKPALPLVVLVDQGTARAAEIVAGVLDEDSLQTVLLGTKTLGLCGLTKAFPLEDGSALVMTVAQCYAPKGAKIQGKGLEPEVPGQKPKASKDQSKAPPQAKTPEQDPWVQQAKDLLISGKPKPVAQNKPAS